MASARRAPWSVPLPSRAAASIARNRCHFCIAPIALAPATVSRRWAIFFGATLGSSPSKKRT